MSNGSFNHSPQRILIASANPLFSKGLEKQLSDRRSMPPEVHHASNMTETLSLLRAWQPDLVIVDYDDHAINRAEFLNHFVSNDAPMQVVLVSLQASGEVVVYDRRTLTPAQAVDWLSDMDAATAVPAAPVAGKTARPPWLSTRWVLTTLLVVLAAAVMVRLGFWQLDRLAQRRAHNAQVAAQAAQPELDLNQGIPSGIEQMDYRAAVVTGEYQSENELILRNQVWETRLGVHLLTPLKIAGSGQLVLVDRGWVPLEQADLPARSQYAEPGQVTVRGLLLLPPPRRSVAGVNSVSGSASGWNSIDLPGIQNYIQSALLPVVLVAAPGAQNEAPPYRRLPELVLTEGSHLGYALQWFSFAAILLAGYPFFVRKQVRASKRGTARPVFSASSREEL